MDAADNLYGTTYCAGTYGDGNVFKLTHAGVIWTYTSLHDFQLSDGANPISDVIFDASGNLYGTTAYGAAASQSNEHIGEAGKELHTLIACT
jgi:uncharacterized repeat protein (TIGR03803 family)